MHSETGRIHTRWSQAVAATGRLSSQDPNLQNIPIRSDLGKIIRRAFIAPPGAVILSADYSQIELRVLAHLSKDPVLVDAFRTGQDVHVRTAMEIFGVPAEGVTDEMRGRSKTINFGVIYGMGEERWRSASASRGRRRRSSSTRTSIATAACAGSWTRRWRAPARTRRCTRSSAAAACSPICTTPISSAAPRPSASPRTRRSRAPRPTCSSWRWCASPTLSSPARAWC